MDGNRSSCFYKYRSIVLHAFLQLNNFNQYWIFYDKLLNYLSCFYVTHYYRMNRFTWPFVVCYKQTHIIEFKPRLINYCTSRKHKMFTFHAAKLLFPVALECSLTFDIYFRPSNIYIAASISECSYNFKRHVNWHSIDSVSSHYSTWIGVALKCFTLSMW